MFVIGDHVAARPRALRVKASTIELIPSLVETLRLVPHYENGEASESIISIRRRAGATSWRIERGPVGFLCSLGPITMATLHYTPWRHCSWHEK